MSRLTEKIKRAGPKHAAPPSSVAYDNAVVGAAGCPGVSAHGRPAGTRPVTETRWIRSSEALWRLAPDRILVRGKQGDAHDLLGGAVLVWLGLEQPRTLAELEQYLIEHGLSCEVASDTLAGLVSAGLVDEIR